MSLINRDEAAGREAERAEGESSEATGGGAPPQAVPDPELAELGRKRGRTGADPLETENAELRRRAELAVAGEMDRAHLGGGEHAGAEALSGTATIGPKLEAHIATLAGVFRPRRGRASQSRASQAMARMARGTDR